VHEVSDSSKNYEEIVQDTGFGLALAKPQGQAIQYDANVQGFTARATHVTYALGYAVTMEELMDNQYEAVSKVRSRANAFSQRQTRENVVANVLNFGFDTGAAYAIGDGKPLFSTTHPTVTGAVYANKASADADLSEASLEDGVIAVGGFLNDRQLVIGVQPRKLIIHRSNQFNAARILQSVLQNDTANNAINALKATNSLPEGFEVNHYMTDSDAWFLKNDIPTGSGLVFFDRMPVVFDMDNDFTTKNALAASVTRFSVLIGDPRCYYGSAGA
jgi:hypothetical protein